MLTNNDVFIIASGSGYLVKIENDTPEMTTNQDDASRFDWREVSKMRKTMTALGYRSRILDTSLVEHTT
jgi:hypothetical protein